MRKQKHTQAGGGAPSGPPPILSSPPAPAVTESELRIRMLRSAATRFGVLQVGMTYKVPADIARHWIEKGLAEQDKALDGAPETK